MKMAELIAQLDGPIYVERVALFDNKQRMRAKKAIKRCSSCSPEQGLRVRRVLASAPRTSASTPRPPRSG